MKELFQSRPSILNTTTSAQAQMNIYKFKGWVLMITVNIPTVLRSLTAKQGQVSTNSRNIITLIDDLEITYPGVKHRLCDEKGVLRRFVNVYVNGEDIRFIDHTLTELHDGDEVSFVPAIAGG